MQSIVVLPYNVCVTKSVLQIIVCPWIIELLGAGTLWEHGGQFWAALWLLTRFWDIGCSKDFGTLPVLNIGARQSCCHCLPTLDTVQEGEDEIKVKLVFVNQITK